MNSLLVRGRLALLVGISLVLAIRGGSWPAAQAQAPAKVKKASALVDVNTATAEELQELPGIGPALAKAIVSGRPYRSVNDLERVQGLGAARLAELKGKVTASRPATPAGGAAMKKKAAGAGAKLTAPVNINTASVAELEELPGIGPAHARAIVAGRPYHSVDDLERVKGLGPSTLEDLADLVTTGASTTTAPRAASKPAVAKKGTAKPAPAVAGKAKTTLPPGTIINVNTATLTEIEELPLIGPVKAAAIIAGRPFKTVEDLKNVKGIGEKTFERIKDSVSVK